ncbi:uncharacterized protein [Branchiostoma lanceolatum]|uniref:uncharacterized protein n=1 Tax=Branchiostoma lanceolatum TaxID=7740 RepID=UPI003453A151
MALALRVQGHMSPRKESAVRAVRREAHHLTRDVQQMYNEYISFDSKRDHFITTLNNVYAQLRKTRYLGKGPDIVTLDAVRSYVYFKGKVAVLRDFFSLLEKLANIRKKVRKRQRPRKKRIESSRPRKTTSSTKSQKKRAGKVSAKSQESRLEEELRMQAAVDREELAELREDVTAINNKLVRLSLEVGREFNRINRSLGELHAYVDEGLSGLVNDSGVDTDISAHAQQRHPFFVTQRYREVPKSRQSRHPTDEN